MTATCGQFWSITPTQMGYFCSTLDSKIQDLTKKKSLAHHITRITHHTAHIAYELEVLYEIKDIDGGTL